MGQRFGTDGIRGIANVELTADLAVALGRAVGLRHGADGDGVLVGRDTRRSGDMLVAAISAGLTSVGVDAHLLGVVPTPAVAFTVAEGSSAAGIMVSASHNPATDNGLKVIAAGGRKLDDAAEAELEALMAVAADRTGPGNDGLGIVLDASDRIAGYRDSRLGIAGAIDARGLRIVVDGANGSGCRLGPMILGATGASVTAIHDTPDGRNINFACGATAPGSLADAVRAAGADLGFALDGDADRLIAVDVAGRVVDGDQVIGILALDGIARGTLPRGAVVVSVLSNGGLVRAVEAAGGTVLRTPVGDRHIADAMEATGAGLGGEKSGHVIVRARADTGDGILTALELLRVMAATGRDLATLAAAVPLLPQEQRAVPARRAASWAEEPAIRAAVAEAERHLGPGGRVLVRPSGTEPALRVMVEGDDATTVARAADAIAAVAAERLD